VTFEERDIIASPAYAAELERLDVFATPATLVDGELVVGFNRKRLEELLG